MNSSLAFKRPMKDAPPYKKEHLLASARAAIQQMARSTRNLQYAVDNLAEYYPEVDLSEFANAIPATKKKKTRSRELALEILEDGPRRRADLAKAIAKGGGGKTEDEARRISDALKAITMMVNAGTLKEKDGVISLP